MKNQSLKVLFCGLLISTSGILLSCGGGEDDSPLVSTNNSNMVDPRLVNSVQGPYKTNTFDYQLPAQIDDSILAGVMTEIWGRIYVPKSQTQNKLPVIILLHGNHATCGIGSPIIPKSCQYTFSGTCASGETVIQNHLGYEYIANRLASWGYAVVSINANRGINCGAPVAGDSGLNLARGRLVLKHLSLLRSWNQGGNNIPESLARLPSGRLDFTQVGLLGHSRGGEGVRAAYNIYNDSGSIWKTAIPDLGIKAIYEIGPVDGQSTRVLDANGVAWNVLLPTCDGDVSNLEGMKPFDRMLNASNESPAYPKSMFVVRGANHNFYNTQWQNNESPGCAGATPIFKASDSASTDQQETAIQSVIPFFRAYVGTGYAGSNANSSVPQKQLAAIFDPLNPLSNDITKITQIDRTFDLSPNHLLEFRLENFEAPTGMGQFGPAHEVVNTSVHHAKVPEHDTVLSAASVQWSGTGYFQNNFTQLGLGYDMSAAQTLDFRIGRASSELNPETGTDLGIQLVYFDNTVSTSIQLSSLVPALTGPVGIPGDLHSTLQSIRIPMSSFGNLRHVRGVRFSFGATPSGLIYISDIGVTRFATYFDASAFILAGMPAGYGFNNPSSNLWDLPTISPTAASLPLKRGPSIKTASIETDLYVEVYNADGFPVNDSLSELRSDGHVLGVAGHFGRKGDLHYLTFRVNSQEYHNYREDQMHVVHQSDRHGKRKIQARVHNKSIISKR